jgi:uncharacterized protein (UPF0303 family)
MTLGKCFEVVLHISCLARHQRFMRVVIFKTAQNKTSLQRRYKQIESFKVSIIITGLPMGA